jgi:ADP-dependent NAD(P)H-hydrate dehydratase / NAD(P)H-hydrate epimerase
MKAVTGAQMREIDRRAEAEYGIPSLLLMENAALRVVEAAEQMLRAGGGRRVTVVAGKGNNGGDGLAAARHLFGRGWDVTVWLVADPESVQGDARVNLEIVRQVGVPLHSGARRSGVSGDATTSSLPSAFEADLIIDALLGTGVRGAPTGGIAEAITAIERSPAPVLAVDLPSGLEADTGAVPGPCVTADRTVTFALPKRGLLVYPGRGRVGEIVVVDIGIPRTLLDDPALETHWITAALATGLLPARPADGHKGTFGRAFVLAGSPGMTGAATLCSEAALRVGAGLVTLGIPASLNPILEVKLTEAMTLPLPETETHAHSVRAWDAIAERVAASDVVAMGPGMGRHLETAELVKRVLRERRGPLVMDADALNALGVVGRLPAPEPAQVVITPHAGEMARLLGTNPDDVQSNRLATAERAARELGCVVVLKGAGSIVAAPDGRLWIGPAGTAALATGGTGDVLTGVIAGLIAQRLTPLDAAIAGVFIHGRAGERLAETVGDAGTLAGDLLPLLPRVLRELKGCFQDSGPGGPGD